MSDKPTSCPECGATLRALSTTPMAGAWSDKPVRVDWDFGCTADSSHGAVHWIEYP